MASPSLPEPPHAPSPTSSKVKVKTTWPTIPPNIARTAIRTERLLLRPYTADDVDEIFELRKQPEVMIWTMAGVVDKNIDESRVFIERFLHPNDLKTFNFAIVYLGDAGENDDAKGSIIGAAGAHKVHPENGWPEVGYMFRKEYWSKGLATEFLRAFTKAWWALPRIEVELEVDAPSVKDKVDNNGGIVVVPEMLTAIIQIRNIGSRRVLEKAGFKVYKTWSEPDSRAGFEGADVALAALLLEAPDS
ncbi:acetyltransferase domain-containing protein [Xylaria cf. heliscus]|nr:acetyltransferase domain-containing protein [Xylaria cf. heliscus]